MIYTVLYTVVRRWLDSSSTVVRQLLNSAITGREFHAPLQQEIELRSRLTNPRKNRKNFKQKRLIDTNFKYKLVLANTKQLKASVHLPNALDTFLTPICAAN